MPGQNIINNLSRKLHLKSRLWLISVMILAYAQSWLFIAIMQRGEKELPITDLVFFLASVLAFRLILNPLLIRNTPYLSIKIFLGIETALSLVPICMAFPTFQMMNWHFCYSSLSSPEQISSPPKNSDNLNLLFLGDSFTNGVGIENPSDRYDHIIVADWNKAVSSPKISGVNYSEPGLGTGEELNLLKQHSLKPDVLIWQYYFNDLDDSKLQGKSSEMQYPLFARLSVTSNFLTGAVFSMLVRYQLSSYNSEMVDTDGETLQRHMLQIDSMIQYCNQKNIQLILLYVPEIISGAESIPVRKHLDSLSAQYHFPMVDSRPMIKHLPVSKRIAGVFDPHASEMVHKIWSDTLVRVLEKYRLETKE